MGGQEPCYRLPGTVHARRVRRRGRRGGGSKAGAEGRGGVTQHGQRRDAGAEILHEVSPHAGNARHADGDGEWRGGGLDFFWMDCGAVDWFGCAVAISSLRDTLGFESSRLVKKK